MIYACMTESEAALWWDIRSEFTDGCRYKVTVNDRNCVFTTDYLYYFENLLPDTEYAFTLEVVDKTGKILGEPQKTVLKTCKSYKCADISAPPYNVVGNAVTDVTQDVQKAFSSVPEDTRLRVTEGVYNCGKITVNGSLKLRFNSGATFVNVKGVKL